MSPADVIVGVRALELETSAGSGRHWLHDDPMSTPVARYPDLRNRRQSAFAGVGPVLVEIRNHDGVVGFAIGVGGSSVVAMIRQLARSLVGLDARAIGAIHERLQRLLGFQVGLGGPAALATSAIDLALWDLAGKTRGSPVASLLGAAIGESLDVYGTGPDAASIKSQGYPLAKITLPPCTTRKELKQAVAHVEAQRESVGADYPLAVDCWAGLDWSTAVTVARALEPLDLAWLEEPFPSTAIDAYARLKRAVPNLSIATGEHDQAVGSFDRLINAGIDILQPDLRWCGGLTDAFRIASLAASAGVALMPHTGGVYSQHFAAACPDSGMLEYSATSPDGATSPPYHGSLFVGEPKIHRGRVQVCDRPGFGLEYSDALADKLENLPRS